MAISLDPIVSLSVAIAEAPGSYAFFLGSGVSRDAGVPTGSQVFWQAVGELYRLEKETDETPEQGPLGEWLSETGRDEMSYSDILELIAPDQATRRDYLAKHFEGREPAASHERLADLVEQGFARVFITTNFDRLLEHALQARGIEPVVITSAAELRSAPRREHAACYVLKPHGDYLQETIRNTPSELQKLEPGIAKELREIFERFGVVVLGYSGSDEAIAQALTKRRSRYGLYWVARGELGEGAQQIIEKTGGRITERPGAAEFLADLQRRLEVFRSHPSGHTPVEVHDEVLALVREGDQVGLGEVMRRERGEFAEKITEVIEAHREEYPEDSGLLSAHDAILPLLERRLGGLLPLIAYAPEGFGREVRAMADLLESRPLVSGYTDWPELANWAVWWLGYSCGAFALAEEAWPALTTLFQGTYTTLNEKKRLLIEPVGESVGERLGHLVLARVNDKNWRAGRWQQLLWSLGQSTIIKERWPESLRGKEPGREVLCDFDFVLTIRYGENGEKSLAHWSMYDGAGVRVARRIRDDPRFRAAVSEAIGVDPENFMEAAARALDNLHLPGHFSNSEATRVLFEDVAQGLA